MRTKAGNVSSSSRSPEQKALQVVLETDASIILEPPTLSEEEAAASFALQAAMGPRR